jgi:hypothetical protein
MNAPDRSIEKSFLEPVVLHADTGSFDCVRLAPPFSG